MSPNHPGGPAPGQWGTPQPVPGPGLAEYCPGYHGPPPQPDAPQHPGYYPHPVAPAARHKGKLVTGIILIVLGSVLLLGRLGAASAGTGLEPGNGAAYYAGALTAFLVIVGAPLVAGIVLVVRSKPRR